YTETNGITASIRLIGANGSSSVVTMWTNRNTTASSDTVRCSSSDTNRGSPAMRIRLTFAMPSATLIVSRISAVAPGPRVRYHNGLGAFIAASAIIAACSGAPGHHRGCGDRCGGDRGRRGHAGSTLDDRGLGARIGGRALWRHRRGFRLAVEAVRGEQ